MKKVRYLNNSDFTVDVEDDYLIMKFRNEYFATILIGEDSQPEIDNGSEDHGIMIDEKEQKLFILEDE